MRTRRTSAALRSMLLATWLLAVAAPSALAEATARFQQTIQQAVTDFEAGRFAQAREGFLEAHQLAPSARTLRALGMVEFELQHYAESIGYLEQALVSKTRPLDEALRREARSVLERAQKLVAHVRVVPSPSDAALHIDGVPTLLHPTDSIALNPGVHVLELSAPGRKPERMELPLQAGEERTLKLALAPALESPKASHTRSERTLYKNPWLWSAVGVVVVGAVTGLAVGLGGRDRVHTEKPMGGDTDTVLTAP